jgi:16S rRNA (guanine527-N7)-methyltransferase
MTNEGIEERVARALEKAGYWDLAPAPRQKLEGYAREVSVWGERMHLVGRNRLAGNLELLILDSLLLLRAAGESARAARKVADIGSGAGFPGVVWKIARPELDMTLFERRLKPGLFLERVVTLLGLEGIEIVGEDAANYREAGAFDLVVSKAAGRFADLLPLVERLLAPNGAYLTIKGRAWKAELPDFPESAMRFESSTNLPEKRGAAIVFRKIPTT